MGVVRSPNTFPVYRNSARRLRHLHMIVHAPHRGHLSLLLPVLTAGTAGAGAGGYAVARSSRADCTRRCRSSPFRWQALAGADARSCSASVCGRGFSLALVDARSCSASVFGRGFSLGFSLVCARVLAPPVPFDEMEA